MKKILLCPPDFYDIEYEINPWMNTNNKVDKERVRDEYEQLKEVYLKLGAEVLEIPAEPGLPDMVYAANFGFPKGNTFIKSNFRFLQRRPEADFAAKFLEAKGFMTYSLPQNVFFEGQGDLLKINGKYFFGWGKRSSFSAKKYLAEKLTGEILDFKLNDPYFYHLDMSLGPLDKNTLVINPRSFLKKDLEKLYKNFKNIIETSIDDNKMMACNLVVVGHTVVIGKGISGQLKKDIEKYGFEVREVQMDEYRKGGGSVKCNTLEFF
ncbi:MAG: arginine deiminase-related protein [Patescibacteria group bacterium]|nr:arginine deiminase-related protein [Patescibacteria group bacterium]